MDSAKVRKIAKRGTEGIKYIPSVPLLAAVLRSLAILTITSVLFGFVWLLRHNQSQSEYLIYIDLWRNYNWLAEGGFKDFLFQNVHTKAITSLAWYLDVWLAGGSLKLFHAILLGVITACIACLVFLAIRLYRSTAAHSTYAFVVAMAAMALWLSPSNSLSMTYPLVGFISSSLLLFLSLFAIIVQSPPGNQSSGTTQCLWVIGCLVVAAFGFFSFETFLAAPLFLMVDAALRKRNREILLHLLIVVFLLTVYLILRERLGLGSAGFNFTPDRDYLALAHNILMLLSTHLLMMFHALEIEPAIAANLSIMVSVIQLAALTFFAVSHYSTSARADLSPRFALLFAIVGITSIALATWRSYSSEVMILPVSRYSPYSVLFSMGVLFLSVRALMAASGRVLRGAAFLAILTSSSYLMAESFLFWFRAYNPAGAYANIRLQMALYADSPENEILTGPGHETHKALGAKHHSFLRANALSVFGSAGYLALGHSLSSVDNTDKVYCKLMSEWSAQTERPEYTMASFRTNDTIKDGVFLAADPNGTIVGFGFAARIHPAQKNTWSLLPKSTETAPLVYHYARTRGAHLVSAVPCEAPW